MASVPSPSLDLGSVPLNGTSDVLLPSEPVLASPSMQELYRLAARAAVGHTGSGLITVLVLGETGTGKEVLARWLHRHSPRAAAPFICINCAALTETLLESELFGYDKGAFTGAGAARPGLLEAAAGGTVFLDEIGEMSPALQSKILRMLEGSEIMRVGGRESRPIDVRFIAATNRDLENEVEARRFRLDLYFRLNGISLTVPPLRDRVAEILPLASGFLAEASLAAGRPVPKLASDAVRRMKAYGWPGNVRELRNAMECALVLCEGSEIGAGHLRLGRPPTTSPALVVAPARVPTPDPSEEAERCRIIDTMAALGGNQTRVAAALGIARGTLITRLERYGIKRPQSARFRSPREGGERQSVGMPNDDSHSATPRSRA
jgi:two-component system, NtrC family, response regulator AtoC